MSEAPFRILLVEDSDSDAALLCATLEGDPEPPAVCRVASLAEAYRRAQEELFDLVLLDLSLPDSAGLDTVWKAHAGLGHQPSVGLTGASEQKTGLAAVRAGAQDFLAKRALGALDLARTARYAVERHRIHQALRQANEALEDKVRQRTAELARAVEDLQQEVRRRVCAQEELEATNALLVRRAGQLRALAGQLTRAEQRERRRVAAVLHDHLQQLLVSARFRLAALDREDGERVRQAARQISSLVEESIQACRTLSAELAPPILHEGGLAAGLTWLSQWMADTHGL
ncbi:MAG: response regulator, partial [Candidatus Latescibacterota bacterium]